VRIAFIFWLLLLALSSYAQHNSAVDSIAHVIKTTTNNSVRANALYKLAREYIELDSKKAYSYALQSVRLAKLIKDPSCEVAALNELSILERNRGDYSKSLNILKQAINIAENAKDTVNISKCFISVGDVYSALLNYNKALDYYDEALVLNQNKQNIQTYSSLSRIGNRLMDKGRDARDTTFIISAISSYLKAKDVAAAINDERLYINAYVSLADAYNIFGKVSNHTQYLYESLNYSMLSLKLAQVAGLKRAEGISYINLGEVYLSLNKTANAIHYFEMAEKIYQPLGNKSWLQNTYEFLGKTYYVTHAYDKSIEYIHKSIALSKEQHLAQQLRDDYHLLAEIYSKQEKFEEACRYYQLYNNYKDSVINENTNFNISRLQTEIDIQRKNREIALLTKNTAEQTLEISTKNNQRDYLIILVVITLIAFVVVFYLYRDRKKAAIEILKAKTIAEKAKEAQEQFLANTSHEIRTPMNGIIGMTSHLMNTSLDRQQKEYISVIKESSNNLLSIINELLDLSKIMAKKILFDKQPFDLEMIIKNMVHLLEFRATEKNTSLTFIIEPAVPKIIIGDAVRLNQILLNLVENSVKFTQDGEIEIYVGLLNENDDTISLKFNVKDTGIGIPEEKLNMIFENFTQVNSKTTRKYGGTGLGLSISKQLVEQQDGSMFVESKVNVGSTFSFTLDFGKQNASNANPHELALTDQPKANLSGVSVLIVDDNKINLKVALLTLQRWNIQVESAESAREAYQKLNQKQIDLILMDITMPDIDGFEATKYIRTELPEALRSIPIIAMTAAAFMGDKEKCLAAGMNDYISKPFSAEDLLQKITHLLKDRFSSDQYRYSNLDLIYERAAGDTEFLKDIIGCYIQEMPVYILEMEECLAAKDYDAISKQAHKMKAPIALMGAAALKELYADIEIKALQQKNIEELALQIETAKKQCLQTVEELIAELKKLD
jgi:signal transduction histidine kinase/CheY-like chemotaxis protein/HPt (histidine-containing phosphotransfer) domain-containing protein